MNQITVGIPTKNRYDSLDKTLLSIALQTVKPLEVIIVDDSDNPIDIRNIPHYMYILRLLNDEGVDWRYIFGAKKGQHFSHQTIQEEARGDLIFRIDDDEVAAPDCLRRLLGTIKGDLKIGAVAPSVTMPNPAVLPVGLRNTIKNLDSPNMQWFKGEGTYDADHLYSCFLYRKGISKFELSLSTVAHREETIFTHSIKRAGYTLKVNMDARVFHFQSPEGGIRTFRDPILWEHDEKIFQSYLNLWNVKNDNKVIILDNGLGDHYAFINILPDLKKKFKNITIACCFPEVFEGQEVTLTSIAEAKLTYGNIDNYNIYKYMGDRNWNRSLVEAFKELYLHENNNITIQPKAEERKREPEKLSNRVLENGYKLVTS